MSKVNSVPETTVESEQTVGTAAEEQTGEATAETDSASGEETEEMEAEDSEVRFQAEWTKDAVIYEVNVRQYTEEGTFNAFSEHLQTLKDMGITTLWFMPIQRMRNYTLFSPKPLKICSQWLNRMVVSPLTTAAMSLMLGISGAGNMLF